MATRYRVSAPLILGVGHSHSIVPGGLEVTS
jgi:hypothetical protein